MKKHSMSFFGQKTGLILNSAEPKDDYIFVHLIKKRYDGSWEKPSKGQGKSIKFNLGEIILIIDVLSKKTSNWTTVHRYQGDTTSISFKNQRECVQIYISNYSKSLKYPETKILRDLLEHIYKEKIKLATGFAAKEQEKSNNGFNGRLKKKFSKQKDKRSQDFDNSNSTCTSDSLIEESRESNNVYGHDILVNDILNESSKKITEKTISLNGIKKKEKPTNMEINSINPREWLKSLQNDGEYSLLPGEIIGKRGKAVSFQINGQNSVWLPISQIKDPDLSEAIGGVWIKNWILEKKLEEIFTAA